MSHFQWMETNFGNAKGGVFPYAAFFPGFRNALASHIGATSTPLKDTGWAGNILFISNGLLPFKGTEVIFTNSAGAENIWRMQGLSILPAPAEPYGRRDQILVQSDFYDLDLHSYLSKLGAIITPPNGAASMGDAKWILLLIPVALVIIAGKKQRH